MCAHCVLGCYGDLPAIVFQCRRLEGRSWSWWCHFPTMDKPCLNPWSESYNVLLTSEQIKWKTGRLHVFWAVLNERGSMSLHNRERERLRKYEGGCQNVMILKMRWIFKWLCLPLAGRRGMRKPIITSTTSLTLRDTMQRLQLFTWTGTKSAWLSLFLFSFPSQKGAAFSIRVR